MKIGIFGGSFNPIHNEHLFLAEVSVEKLNLDKVLFIPTYKPLYKEVDSSASYHDRAEMVRLAISNKKEYELSMIDFELNKNSYTYFTLLALREKFPNDELFFLMGKDSYLSFCTWYKWKKLIDLATFVVIERDGVSKGVNESLELPSLKNKFIQLNCSGANLSSSLIRLKVKSKESIHDMVPISVEEYIKKHELYK